MRRIFFSISVLIFIEVILLSLDINVSIADPINGVYYSGYSTRQNILFSFISWIFFQGVFVIISLVWRYIFPKKGISPIVFFFPTYCFSFVAGVVGFIIVTGILYFINKEIKNTSFFSVNPPPTNSELDKSDKKETIFKKPLQSKHEIFSEYKVLDRSRLRNEQPNANQPEIHTDKNTVQSKDDESEKECMFHDIPNTLTLSSDNTFDITFKGLNISDSLSWKCSSGIKIVKAEFEIGPDLLATASFKADNSDGEILLISIVVNYKNKNYIANYIKENNHFILNV